MNNTKTKIAAVLAATFLSTSAFASLIQATSDGAANFGFAGVGYETGAIAPTQKSETELTAVLIGGDSFRTADNSYDFSATGQFNTWCVDIYHWMRVGAVSYNVGSTTDLVAALSPLRSNAEHRVNQLLQLANEVYSTVDSKEESAAFQLAVWEISYGTADASGHGGCENDQRDTCEQREGDHQQPGAAEQTGRAFGCAHGLEAPSGPVAGAGGVVPWGGVRGWAATGRHFSGQRWT